MEQRRYIVYCHTLISDGRKYIGITCQKPENRWNGGRGYKATSHHTHFANAIKMYGWDAFAHEVLYENLSKDEAQKLEIFLIDKYKTTDRRFGFNTLLGGNLGQTGIKQSQETIEKRKQKLRGQKRNNETRAKISEWHKNAPLEYRQSLSKSQQGKVLSKGMRELISQRTKEAMQKEEVKSKLGKSSIGRMPWNKGIPMNEETRRKVSASLKGKPNISKRKCVRCIETGKVYKSVLDASKEFGYSKSSSQISMCCNGKRKTAHGYKWEFVNDEGG